MNVDPARSLKHFCLTAVEGVTVYISDFKRSLVDKLSKNFFSEPSQVRCMADLQHDNL